MLCLLDIFELVGFRSEDVLEMKKDYFIVLVIFFNLQPSFRNMETTLAPFIDSVVFFFKATSSGSADNQIVLCKSTVENATCELFKSSLPHVPTVHRS